jgi:hypothetical protein
LVSLGTSATNWPIVPAPDMARPFWDITPCSQLRFGRRVRGTCRRDLRGRRKSQALFVCPFFFRRSISYTFAHLVCLRIVAYLLKERTVEPEKQPLLANGVETTFVSKQRLGKYIPASTVTHATI